MPTRLLFRFLAVCVCVLLVSACGTTARKKGLEQLKSRALYSGVATHDGASEALVVVVLLDARDEIAGYSVADPAGRFDILVAPGEYRLLAYADLDADFQWDEGEPWAIGASPAVDVSERPDEVALNTIAVDSSNGAPPTKIDLAHHELPTGEEIWEAALGRLVSIDDPILGSETGLSSLWHPVDFLKAKNAGVFLVDEFDPAKIVVVFVNGIGGSPSELRTVAERLDHARFQAVFITYPSGLPVEFNGWFMYRLAVELRARRGYDGETIFVAHSMGGLVARSMINRLVRAGGHLPLAFISISTPWGGHDASSERGSRIAAVPVWADLVPESSFIHDLYEQPLPDDLHYYLLFGYSGESALVRGSDDGIVSISSMLDYRAQDQARKTWGFAETHTSILESDKAIGTVMQILDEEAARVRTRNRN